MKRVILILCAVFTISLVHAQQSSHQRADQPAEQKDQTNYRQDAGELVDKLNEKLNLTSNQYKEVKEISMKKADKAEAINHRYSDDSEKKQQMMEELIADYQTSIKQILDEEQKEKLDNLVEKWKNE